MFISWMWQLDNYLTILAIAGFAIYFFLCFLGWLFDQFIDYFLRGWRVVKKHFLRIKTNFSIYSVFGMDP